MEDIVKTGYRDKNDLEICMGDIVTYEGNEFLVIRDKMIGWIIHPSGNNLTVVDYQLEAVHDQVQVSRLVNNPIEEAEMVEQPNE